jgi:cephalosporin hydroxylase
MLSIYKDIPTQQSPRFVDIFFNFFQKQNFDYIIEIGTAKGGLTRFIKDMSPRSIVLSYDIKDKKTEKYDKSGIEFRIKNVFDKDYKEIVDQELLTILKSNSKKLILCDGGNKRLEFNCLAKFINVDDFIMAHDYCINKKYFKENIYKKIWNWCEITESDIDLISKEQNLIHFDQDEFQKIVWVCKKKIK